MGKLQGWALFLLLLVAGVVFAGTTFAGIAVLLKAFTCRNLIVVVLTAGLTFMSFRMAIKKYNNQLKKN